MIEHLRGDAGTCHGGRAKYGVIAANHQDFAEFHHGAGFGFEPVNPEHVLSGNAILLAARFDDREHLFRPLCSCTILGPKGPDRLLAIVIYLSLQKHSVDATPRRNKARGRQERPRDSVAYGGGKGSFLPINHLLHPPTGGPRLRAPLFPSPASSPPHDRPPQPTI